MKNLPGAITAQLFFARVPFARVPFARVPFARLLCKAAALSLMMTLPGLQPGFAAGVPAGVALHPTQTIIRNNGSEPESLDPAPVSYTHLTLPTKA